jgi:hypothetical protein
MAEQATKSPEVAGKPLRRAEALPHKTLWLQTVQLFTEHCVGSNVGQAIAVCGLPSRGTGQALTKEDALLAFAMEFSSTWRRIAQAPDDLLAPDAQGLKQKLLRMVNLWTAATPGVVFFCDL